MLAYREKTATCFSRGFIVLQTKQPITCWGMGLSEDQTVRLRECLGDEAGLVLWEPEAVPGVEDMERDSPCVLWLSSTANRKSAALEPTRTRHLDLIPKVVLLETSYSLRDFEEAGDGADIVRPPLTKKRVRGIMRRALEAQEVHHDIMCMTKEILLERELLERKNKLLGFLVNFLGGTSECSEPSSLLDRALAALRDLFPVRTLHAAMAVAGDETSLRLFIGAASATPEYEQARKLLLTHARDIFGPAADAGQEHTLAVEAAGVAAERTFCLPLSAAGSVEGVLILETPLCGSIGRDQAQALESALGHLALSLKNACALEELRRHADYDALTGMYCRRHLDRRLGEEMDRFKRYGRPFSLVLMDIDHFKRVNDTRGHHAGDRVLREAAEIVRAALRTSDYCARYGGEEFCIILPDTDASGALIQAERLRKAMAGYTFLEDSTPLRLTASFGIASARRTEADAMLLLCEADSAMYQAKNSGRNRCRLLEEPLQDAG